MDVLNCNDTKLLHQHGRNHVQHNHVACRDLNLHHSLKSNDTFTLAAKLMNQALN